jgi:CheY-like chemotaxis protein
MKKILIVEDELIVRSIYRRKFEISGYQVEVAEDGLTALKLLGAFRPDAVQVDIMLPGMDGVEVIRQIRAQPDFKNTPILVISSFYRPDLAKEAWKAGATKCVSKMDCTPNLALELMEQMLNGESEASPFTKMGMSPIPNEALRMIPAESPWEEATRIVNRVPVAAAGLPISTAPPSKPHPTLPIFARKALGISATPESTAPKATTTTNFAKTDAENLVQFPKEEIEASGLFVKPDPEGARTTTRPHFAIPQAQKLPPAADNPEIAAPADAPTAALPVTGENGNAAFHLEIRHEFLKRAPQIQADLRGRVGSLLKSKSPTEQLSLLGGLETAIASLASLSGITGFSRISHLADALDALIKDLQKKPARMTNSVLRTVAHASDCLNTLFRDLEHAPREIPQSMLILAVDDEPIARRTISVALGKANLRCITMEDSKAALAMLRENSFDLIFLDAEMPELNGFQLCTELRKLPTNKTTPVIFVTSLTKFEVRAQSSLAGGNDLIAKPFLMMELAVKALTYLLRPKTVAESK